MQKKGKTLVYKEASGFVNGATLQQELHAELENRIRAVQRLQRVSETGDEHRLINDTRQHSNMLFGAFQAYTRGAAQLIIGVLEDAREWPIHQVAPPPSDEERHREFIEGLLFFGIWKNHVLLLQSNACRAGHFEDYLNWLLRLPNDGEEADGAPPEPPPQPIYLNDLVPQSVRSSPFRKVTGFKFKTDLESTPAAPGQQVAPTQRFSFRPSGEVWNGILAALRREGAAVIDELPLEEALSPDSISVNIELTCKKKCVDTAGQVLAQLANSMRNVETDFYEITFEDGKRLRGSELKISKKVSIECEANVPAPLKVHQAMHSYLRELILGGTLVETDSLEIENET